MAEEPSPSNSNNIEMNLTAYGDSKVVVLEYVRYKAGDQTQARQRAIYYYLLNVKQEPWQTKEDIKEYLEVFHHWYQLENYDTAFDVLRACNDFLILRGYYTIQVDLYGQLIAAWQKKAERNNLNHAAAFTSLGNAYHSLGQYQETIKWHEKSLHIKREIGDHKGQATSLGNLGNAYDSLGQYPKAIDYYQKSLEIFQKTGDRSGEGTSLNNLGIAYRGLRQYPQAIDFFQKSLKIFEEIGERRGEGNSLASFGNIYYVLGQDQQAIEYYQQSVEIFKEIGDRSGEGNSLGNLGNVYRSLENYERAVDYYQQSLQIQTKIGNLRGQANAWFNLGLTLEKVYRESDALGAYRNAHERFQEMGLNAELLLCNNAIERISQPKTPVVSRRGFSVWLRRLWRWVRSWFRQ